MLTIRRNPKTRRREYCLVSVKNPKKVLQYFGSKRPSDEQVRKVESRVEHFANKEGGT
jgi:hypothetical protein